ncbi:MAG: exo-alpha-sialidase, partial [Nitrosopumilus sp.]|nr:exo-alpha-sialidase [Nitrosopumilus sp.]
MKFLVLLILVGFSGVILNDYHEYPFAFGLHEDEHQTNLDDPVISIQDDKANIIWKAHNQNADSEITFTQIVDGKTTIQPKTILKEPRIGFTKIVSHDDNILVVYEQYTPNNQSPPSFFMLSSYDDGKTFSVPKLLLTSDNVYYDIGIVEIANQKLYVFGTLWTMAENTSYVFYSVSDDFGNTFSAPTKIFNQGKVRQDIVTTVSNDVIYLLMDDEKDFDEKGHLYLIKILPDGTVTERVSVNNAETSIHNQKIAVSGGDVYVSWLDRPNDTRWYSSFTASHDGGMTFEKSKYLPSDPDSIDTYHPDGLGIFVTGETVNVLWESDYWDGESQTIKTFVGTSNNKGKDFHMEELPANSFLSQYGRVLTLVDGDKQYYLASGLKNYPYKNSAMYFNVKDEKGKYSEIVD